MATAREPLSGPRAKAAALAAGTLLTLGDGCAGDDRSDGPFGPGDGATDDGGGDDDGGAGDDGGTRLDVGDPGGEGPGGSCKVVGDEMDGVGCTDVAPPDAFDPQVQWTFGADIGSVVTPLVGNLTDDDGDGEIDLCDVPDVVLVAGEGILPDWCKLYVLDGATGAVHVEIGLEERIACWATPAIGDIDDDGIMEIVAIYGDGTGDFFDGAVARIKAFEHDGTRKWVNTTDGGAHEAIAEAAGTIALHDLDADGDVEILFNHAAYDHRGKLLWQQRNPDATQGEVTTAVDLDGDGKMEVLTGHAAYRADGSVYFDNYPQVPARAIPQVGNLDGDPEPEIFVTSVLGIYMLEHDGTLKYGPVRPTGVEVDLSGWPTWLRPGTIHDFDGDQEPEWASSSREFYAVYEGPDAADILWRAQVLDHTGAAAGTAFDFLGDGVAEAMYGDEGYLYVYDGRTGDVLLQTARGSSTYLEFPTVADVDNDGSAEILVVSEHDQPAIQVVRDREDRWVPARRIWNQHAYYVTNVREDGAIPQHPVDNWDTLNTFRTQAQIDAGGVCRPEPEG